MRLRVSFLCLVFASLLLATHQEAPKTAQNVPNKPVKPSFPQGKEKFKPFVKEEMEKLSKKLFKAFGVLEKAIGTGLKPEVENRLKQELQLKKVLFNEKGEWGGYPIADSNEKLLADHAALRDAVTLTWRQLYEIKSSENITLNLASTHLEENYIIFLKPQIEKIYGKESLDKSVSELEGWAREMNRWHRLYGNPK